MTKQTNIDIDYEHMDDLPLSEHFEWRFFQVDKVVVTKKLNDDHAAEWQAGLITRQ